ncbi:MAG: hypothetical protein HC897_20300, partial [Thermoanaerobaculia bacterium]|nr:hypothetical protein [Thermoanaerobaculia bacterium]
MRARSTLAIASLLLLHVVDSPTSARAQSQTTAPTEQLAQMLAETLEGARASAPKQAPASFPLEYRSIDGTDNNLAHRRWGAARTALVRTTTLDYANGVDAPAGSERPSAREVSNAVVWQERSMPNSVDASDFVWQWGQFLDHDLDLAPTASPAESFDVEVPEGDAYFDPNATGRAVIKLDRSEYRMIHGVREQMNVITAFIDASNVYGSDPRRARELRTLDGSGRLKTSPGDLLPFNVHGFDNAPDRDPTLFLAGDVRANEQVGLTAMHTLFVREHNFWADTVRSVSPRLSDDEIYETARAMVAAEMQAITYREFLPVILGRNALSKYRGYDPSVNAGIANVFATSSYRFGHSMLSPQLLRLDENNDSIPAGPLSLASAFFNPEEISEHGIEPLLRGLSRQRAQTVDAFVVDEVRNFLLARQVPAARPRRAQHPAWARPRLAELQPGARRLRSAEADQLRADQPP